MANELEPVPPAGALAETQRPDWMEKTEGSPDIGLDDIRLPRLAIAQGLSPQMVPDTSQTIDGLRLFDLFNDLTGEIYGRGPLRFVPVLWWVKNIEFEKGPDGKNTSIIRDEDVPSGDPRTKWVRDNVANTKTPPAATRYTEMVCFLLHDNNGREPETIIISVKETNRHMRRAAKTISGGLTEHAREYYGGIYSVKSMPEKFDKGTAGVFVFGIRPTLWVTDKALYARGKQLKESLQGKTIIVNRDNLDVDADADVGDTSFDTSQMEDPEAQ